MVSLHRIGRRARMPETLANCVQITSQRIWITSDLPANALWRISRLSGSYRWRRRCDVREKESRWIRTHRLQMIWKLRLSMRGEKGGGKRYDSISHPPEFLPAVVTPGFSVPITSFRRFQPRARSVSAPAENFVLHYVTTGDESKMNRGRKSRRPQAISTENFTGKFTLAYLIAPLHHQRYCRPHDKVIRCCLPALTLMMRNHTRSAKAFTCNVIRCAQLEWFAMREYALPVTLILMI